MPKSEILKRVSWPKLAWRQRTGRKLLTLQKLLHGQGPPCLVNRLPQPIHHFNIFLHSSKFLISFFSCLLFHPALTISSSFCNFSVELSSSFSFFLLHFILFLIKTLLNLCFKQVYFWSSLNLSFPIHPLKESLRINELHYLTILVKYICHK